jgi:hypothetical protein
MKLRFYTLALATACLAVTASAKSDWYSLGLTGGIVLPSSSELRDVFGSSWIGFGLSPTGKDMANRWSLSTDIELTYADKNGNRLLLIPVSAGVGRQFDSKDSDWTPYVAARVGAAYMDYAITRPSNLVRYKEETIGFDANAEIGMIYKKNLRFSVRYDVYSESNDFNFDGLTLGVSWTFTR